MKSWKDQLKAIKRALRGLRGSDSRKTRGEKPEIDFEPPSSWLNDEPSTRSRRGNARSDPHQRFQQKKQLKNPAPDAERVKYAEPHQPAKPNFGDSASVDTSTQEEMETPPAVFRPHIDRGRSLNMPDWANAGRLLHHPDYQMEKGGMTVRIGLDLGTAFTKVAVRVGARGGDLVMIDWSDVTGDKSPEGRYLLPGFVMRLPDGRYDWVSDAAAMVIGNLKLPLLEMADSDECPTAALAYLALVIRYARAYLYRSPEVGRRLVHRSLRWELNLGCPTEPHEKPDIVQRLQRIARTAWWLASAPSLWEADIVAAWRKNETEVGLETDPGIVPEFVAQIAGYVHSSQASEGLHALIDIGAATLDVATFNIVLNHHDASPPRIPIFFSAVCHLGTHYLNRERHDRLKLDSKWDDAAPVEPAEVFAERHGKSVDEVRAVDDGFAKRVTKRITSVIGGTRTNGRGDPRSSAWRDGLPLFITGGGSDCELYRRCIDKVESEIKRELGLSNRFRFIELDPIGPRMFPSGVKALGRLTVAIGLTEDAESIARIVPHRDIEPIKYPRRPPKDHSEIYSDR